MRAVHSCCPNMHAASLPQKVALRDIGTPGGRDSAQLIHAAVDLLARFPGREYVRLTSANTGIAASTIGNDRETKRTEHCRIHGRITRALYGFLWRPS